MIHCAWEFKHIKESNIFMIYISVSKFTETDISKRAGFSGLNLTAHYAFESVHSIQRGKDAKHAL